MRDLANITHDGPKWIVLDGDIDPMWIESLNTVMDDNKVRDSWIHSRAPVTTTVRESFQPREAHTHRWGEGWGKVAGVCVKSHTQRVMDHRHHRPQ